MLDLLPLWVGKRRAFRLRGAVQRSPLAGRRSTRRGAVERAFCDRVLADPVL